ncbi:MAG: hypothetical protein GVY13_07800 [Alphaproteobacteria bacterium]|nr:hypothetical protein [Alphaproteobacteria bacterium]
MRIVFRCPPELEGLLPRPVPARRGLPDWLKRMAMTAADADLGFAVRTVKQCPPFVDAMAAGFLMPLAADIRVRDGTFAWDWDPPHGETGTYSRSPLGVHTNSQAAGTPLFDPAALIVKFMNFWTIELPEGWSLLCTHPVNRADLPFRTVTGLVDADTYGHGLIHFPAQWTDTAFEGVLPAGTPVAQCLPVPRQALDLSFETLTGDAANRFAETERAVARKPGAYKRRFRARKR